MSVYVCVRGNMHVSVCMSTCLYVSDCARVCALVCSLTTPCLTTEPLSQFCVGFDELVLPPTNRLESQSPVVLEMAEELRELVRSDEFQICFTETCDDLFGTLVPAIKKFFATAVASLRDGGDAVPLMLLVPPVANEAWTVLNSKDDNPYFEKVMRSASPMRMNQFLMLSIFKPEDFELGSHLPFLSAE